MELKLSGMFHYASEMLLWLALICSWGLGRWLGSAEVLECPLSGLGELPVIGLVWRI
jgi:hypothetical protein